MRIFYSLSFVLLLGVGESLAMRAAKVELVLPEKKDYAIDETVAGVLHNETPQRFKYWYAVEVRRDGHWRPWSYGSLSGKRMEIAKPMNLGPREKATILFALRDFKPSKSNSLNNCARRTKFRFVVSIEGIRENIHSREFSVSGCKRVALDTQRAAP